MASRPQAVGLASGSEAKQRLREKCSVVRRNARAQYPSSLRRRARHYQPRRRRFHVKADAHWIRHRPTEPRTASDLSPADPRCTGRRDGLLQLCRATPQHAGHSAMPPGRRKQGAGARSKQPLEASPTRCEVRTIMQPRQERETLMLKNRIAAPLLARHPA